MHEASQSATRQQSSQAVTCSDRFTALQTIPKVYTMQNFTHLDAGSLPQLRWQLITAVHDSTSQQSYETCSRVCSKQYRHDTQHPADGQIAQTSFHSVAPIHLCHHIPNASAAVQHPDTLQACYRHIPPQCFPPTLQQPWLTNGRCKHARAPSFHMPVRHNGHM
jgi:hypothetical protein